MHSGKSMRFGWHAILSVALSISLFAPRPAHALEICVETLNDLINGLNATLTPQADGTVTLRLVAQTYAWNGAQLAVLGNRLNLLGGYAPGCASRTVNPANTVINGLGALDLEFFEQGLGVTVEGIRFSNVQFLRLNSAQQCFDYGNAVTWRRTIVDGTAGDFRIGSSCGPLIFQNNAVLQTLGTVLQLTPENLPIDAFVVNNTFFDSLGDGLRLFRGEDTAISTFRLGNNLIWSSTGIDLALFATGDLPLVTAFNNTFVSSNVPISDGADNTSLDPQLNANGVPAVPGSPAINSGTNSPPGSLPAVDIIGNPRLIGSAADRGAYESNVVDATELVVTNASDSGSGSLRQAILDANSLPSFNTIRFAIPGGFGAILLPQTPYPDIVTPMRIDGFTQPGALPNTSDWSNNAQYQIDIAGGGTVSYAFRVPTNAPATAKLDLRGLRMGGFSNAVLLQGGSGHIVRGNHFGKFGDGLLSGSDNINAIYVNANADNVDIGGFDPAARNSIAGDQDPPAGNGYGIYIGGNGDGHLVAGNLIGTFPNGNTAHGHQVGLRVESDLNVVASNLVSGNVIGMQVLGSDNLIAGNRVGVKAFAFCLPPCVPDYALPNANGALVYAGANDNDFDNNQLAWNSYSGLIMYPGALGNTLSANRVHDNTSLNLDLRNPAGMNAIDGDGPGTFGCEEANCDQNFPLLSSATGVRYEGRVQGSLSTANGEYRIEFYRGSTCGVGGQGGGSLFLGATNVVASGGSLFPPINGSATFDVPITSPATLYNGFITATATSAGGNTSEYSACVAYGCDQIFAHNLDSSYAQVCPATP
jgi:hypothetical protein